MIAEAGNNPITPTFYPPPDYVCTEAYGEFIREYRSHVDFFFFIVNLATTADKTRIAAAQALAIVSDDPAHQERYAKHAAAPDSTFQALRRFSTVASQNLTNGIVNAFQRYFSSLIQSVALKCPQVMTSSKDQVRVDEILRFTRHRDLVNYIIDRKINSLSYGGLDELDRYFDDRLNIKMFHNDRQKLLLRLFVEARNINVHNRGRVNDIFVQRVGEVEGFPYKEGRVFHIDLDELIALSENAMAVAQAIDASVGLKYDLRRKAISSWHRSKGDKSPSASSESAIK